MKRRPLTTICGSFGLGVVALAVVRELRLPPELRHWHGVVLGVVPYDFRRPTLARVREAFWSPDDERVLMPRVVGVGWAPNIGRLARLCGETRHRRGALPRGDAHHRQGVES